MLVDFLVRPPGLEPGRGNHTPLKRTRLPVPPWSHINLVQVAGLEPVRHR